jgi:hypothetical protein
MFTISGLSLESRPPPSYGPVAWDDLIPSARKAALDQVGSVASTREIEYLRTIYVQFRQREFRQTDLARHLDVSQPQVSRVMDRLQAMRLVELVREEPPSKYLRLAGLTLIALGWNPGGGSQTRGRAR